MNIATELVVTVSAERRFHIDATLCDEAVLMPLGKLCQELSGRMLASGIWAVLAWNLPSYDDLK